MATSTIPAPPGPQAVVPPPKGSARSGLIALTYALGATSLIAAAVIDEGIVHPFGAFVVGLFLLAIMVNLAAIALVLWFVCCFRFEF
jgi:hypothetical protein